MDLFGTSSPAPSVPSQKTPPPTSTPVEGHPLLGMAEPHRFLKEAMTHNRFPHGLLFQGKEGVGKRHFAQWIAWQLLRGQTTFDETPSTPLKCPLYHRMLQGGHGDFLLLSPEGTKDIPVQQVRKVVHFFQRKPMEADWRVVIIDQAHRLNRFGANGLLKILEEPPQNCLLILIGGPSQNLLPTLISRCQRLDFQGLSPTDFDTVMAYQSSESLTSDTERNALVYRLADGAPGLAQKIMRTEADAMLRDFMATARYLTHRDFSAITRFVRKWESKAHEEAFALFPTLLFSWTDQVLQALFTQTTTQLTLPEQAVTTALKNRSRIFQWITTVLQSSLFFQETNVFHLDRGAILYTFFLKLYIEGSQWPSHSTSQRLFTM